MGAVSLRSRSSDTRLIPRARVFVKTAEVNDFVIAGVDLMTLADVVRIDCTEALVTPDLRPLAERKVFWYVKVPAAWVADGTVKPTYSWTLDLARLLRGERLPDVDDRLHKALLGAYAREAQAQRLAEPADVNATQPMAVAYRVLTQEEAEKKPWKGTACLRVDEGGTMQVVRDTEL